MASTLTPKLRAYVESRPEFRKSCLSGKVGRYGDPIRIHHAFKWQNRQLNEKWSIAPLLDSEHDNYPNSAHRCQETRERVELWCLMRASEEEIKRYGLEQKKKYLRGKYK
jgi:hypothetical protein